MNSSEDSNSESTESGSEEEKQNKPVTKPMTFTIPGLKLTKTDTKDGSSYSGKGTTMILR